MKIFVNQIDSNSLISFITQTTSGTAFSGNINSYVLNGGYLGPNIVYSSGYDQTISGNKTFANSPIVPYTGTSGTAPSKKYVDDAIALGIQSFSGNFIVPFAVLDINDDIISGYKQFTGAVGVGLPTQLGHAVQLNSFNILSGIIASGLTGVTVVNTVYLTGDQSISGTKTFLLSPNVPTPTASGHAVNLGYLSNFNIANAVYNTGNQSISGVITFAQSPIIPIATAPNQPVQLAQLNAYGVSQGPVSGFAGVMAINGSTGGASGLVYLIGGGTVTVTQCGPIFTISGNTASVTQLYAAQIPLPASTTGINYVFGGSGFATKPTISADLEVTGGSISFINSIVYNVNQSGFGVAFSSGLPNSSYVLHVAAIPTSGGSGFLGIQGGQGINGATLNPRGNWYAGTVYNNLDYVFTTNPIASYSCLQTHISNSFNPPNGTGTNLWQIMSSGSFGQTGFWAWQGNFNTGSIYRAGYSAFYNGSSYGFTGSSPVSGFTPDALTGGWTMLAQQGGLGNLVISGNVTGNFTNISFFMNPVGTGQNLAEVWSSQTFNFTGLAIGCITTGAAPLFGGITTGNIYVRSFQGVRTNIINNWTFNTGVYSVFSGGFGIPVTGMYRIGVDILNITSGLNGVTVGIFGF